MTKKWGFVGGGAMCEALVSGMVTSGLVPAKQIFVSDHKAQRCEYLQDKYGVEAMVGADSFAAQVDYLVLAIKPQVAGKAMAELSGLLSATTVIVSIVAGLTIAAIQEVFPEQQVIRVMPNTPMSVGAGMSAYALSDKNCSGAEQVHQVLAACGQAVEVQEYMLDAVTGLSGSGPAYGFLMIDALSDGGVAAGLPRKTATLLAAQTLLGAAKMVLETGEHPDVLRDQVTSPAGTTIAGVRVMEQQGLRGTLIDTVLAATAKSQSLGKK